jgi:DNA-binding transcriptional regulator GbsR (MarR family)|tara:strand:- start:226 stop:486 length:261 start_codon:yes stop_codon:yes gene_type:complete
MNSTSIEAYKTITENGTVGQQAIDILDFLKFKGKPMTNKEIQTATGLEISSVSGRINDLKKHNMVTVVGKRPCKVTGNTVTIVKPI